MAPTSTMGADDTSSGLSTELGIVPHQIRGHLDRFQNTVLCCKAFDRCTACSEKVHMNIFPLFNLTLSKVSYCHHNKCMFLKENVN